MPLKNIEARKNYTKKYHQEHRTQILNRHKKYHHDHKEEAKKYRQKEIVKDRQKEHEKKYRLKNREKIKFKEREYSKKYYDKHRRESLEYHKKYLQTSNGRKIAGMANRRHCYKRRFLGFIPLNEPFEGSVSHHVDHEHVVFIPEEIHKSVYHNIWTGQNMNIINDLAIQFLEGTKL